MIYKDIFPHKIVVPNGNHTYCSVNYPHEFPKIAYAQFDIKTGKGLLDFIEFDLSEVETKILEIAVSKSKFDEYELEDLIRDICDSFKDKHDYLFFFINGKVERLLLAEEESGGDVDFDRIGASLNYLLSISGLQVMYRDILNNFLIQKNNSSFSEKFDLILKRYPDFQKTVIKKTITIIGKDDNSRVSEAYIIEILEEMLFFEFMEMLRLDIRVKKCKLCGRYFVLPDKRRHEFCGRVYKDDKTCKDVGSKVVFNEKTRHDEVLKFYMRKYNKLYSRMYRAEGKEGHERSGKDMTKEEFEVWVTKAKKAVSEYKVGRISEEEFTNIIK